MGTAPSLTGEILRFTVEATKGPHAGLKMEFHRSSITVGRGPENDIILADDPRISRQHIEIKQSLGQFYIANLSAKNFILVNGENVASGKLESKSAVQIGQTELSFTVQGSTNLLDPMSAAPVAPAPPARAAAPPPAPLRAVPPMAPPPSPWAQAAAAPAPHAPPLRNAGPSPIGGLMQNKRFRIYGIIAIAGLLIFAMSRGGRSQRADDKPFRSTEQLELARLESENDMKLFRDRKEKMQTVLFQKAHENFLRGYRDYRQGQYGRAREAFQVVLNLDPGNELAHRYYNLTQIRLDERVKFHMLQGRRYLEKQNHRMCKSNFQTVMTMLGNDALPEYKEAKALHEQCATALEGRF